MCVPVVVDGQRVGRFDVDIPYSQTYLNFRIMVAKEVVSRSPHADNFEIQDIRIPLTRRWFEIEMIDYNASGTMQIVAMLERAGVPVYSDNIQREEDRWRNRMVYSYRAYETTQAGLEEIFDLDQFIPE